MPKERFVHDFLTADHRRLDLLFDSLMHAIQAGDALEKQQSLFLLFKNGLKRHIHWEETVLFPIFENMTGMTHGPTQVMRAEHEEMNTLLSDLEATMQQGFDVDYLQGLAHRLMNHNEKEERILYPAIDEISRSDDREAIAVELSRDFR